MNSDGFMSNKWIDTKTSWLVGKSFIWVWVFSMLYNGRQGISEMWKNWMSQENKNDIIDLWVWMIPIIWWIHDLKIAIEWKDLNNRELSNGERAMRTWFGIIGLIPGAWFLTKTLFKWSKAIVAGSEVAIQAAHLSWKVLTYSALWISIWIASYDMAFK